MAQKTAEKHQHITKSGTNNETKSMKNLRKIEVASEVRFGRIFGSLLPQTPLPFWISFGGHFQPKSEKRRPGIDAKTDTKK